MHVQPCILAPHIDSIRIWTDPDAATMPPRYNTNTRMAHDSTAAGHAPVNYNVFGLKSGRVFS